MLKSALIVIDFINDIVHENGKAPSCAAFVKEHAVIEKTNLAIKQAREKNGLILFVKVAFNPGYLETPRHSPIFKGAPGKDAFKLGEWGTEFHAQLDYQPNDPVIIKPRVSAFYGTPLEAYLRAQQINNLVICGVSTNNAVQATARDGHDRDYQIVILKDACGASNTQVHENTLGLLEPLCTLTTAEKILN